MTTNKDIYAKLAEQRFDAKVRLFDSWGIAVETAELEALEGSIYETIMEPTDALRFVPVDTGYNPTVESISYKESTRTGVAKTIGSDSDDRPTVGTYVKKLSASVHEGGASYTYSVDSADRAKLTGFNEVAEDARACAMAIAEWHDKVALNGNGISGITGFANNASVAEAVDTTQAWTLGSTTGAAMFQDIAFCINKIAEDSKGAHKATNVALPINVWNGLAITRFDTTSSFTVLEKLRANYPGVAFDQWAALATAGTTAAARVIAYEKSPRNMVYRATVLYDEDLPFRRNFKFEVAARGRSAGVTFRYPLAAKYQDITVA